MSLRRDYKSRTPRQRRQSVRRHGLLVVTLILVGVFGGLLAYIKGDRAPEMPVAAMPPVKPALPALPALPATPASPPTRVGAAPAAAESEPAKPKYDFYTELPKRQVDIQRAESNPRTH